MPLLTSVAENVEALRVVLSIGPTEAMHFQTWSDKAGNTSFVANDNGAPHSHCLDCHPGCCEYYVIG